MHRRFALVIASSLVLAACNAMGPDRGGSSSAPSPSQVSGIALPVGHTIVTGDTLVVGEGDRWTGRYTYNLNSSTADMVDFYRRDMPALGWNEVAVARGETSLLTYASPATGRLATVQIAPRTLFGSRVTLTVSPMSGAAGAASQTVPQASVPLRPEVQQPPPPPAPREAITSQPLR
jgi:hypothetical protein